MLIVDDEPVVLKSLAVFFRRRGYDVLPTSSGASALDILRTRTVDGLVVDFRLPDMRGDAVYCAAMALQPHLERHTVFITGDISGAVTETAADFPCPVVLKPFDLSELERVVEKTIGPRMSSEGGKSALG